MRGSSVWTCIDPVIIGIKTIYRLYNELERVVDAIRNGYCVMGIVDLNG